VAKADPRHQAPTVRRVVQILLSQGPLLAGAQLFSWLLYPGSDPRDAQGRQESECAVGFEAARLAASNTTRTQALVLPPLYLRLNEAVRGRILRKANDRLQHRLIAARMVWPFLRQVVLEHMGAEADPQTIAALAEKYRVEAGESDPINVQSRVLRPSYRVLHLAVGLERLLAIGVGRDPLPSVEEVRLALLSKADFPSGVAKLMSYEFLLNPAFTVGLLELSEVVASLVALAPRLRGAERQLIRFVADA
jgi:hypothetical protein